MEVSPGPEIGFGGAQVLLDAAVGLGLSELPEPRGGGGIHLPGGNRQAYVLFFSSIPGIWDDGLWMFMVDIR